MAKVLIVDDSEVLLAQLKIDLEAAGHAVVQAIDGVKGIEALEANPGIELILCDVNMPNMDGLTMCAKVHTMDAFKSIPKLMLTTEANAQMKEKGKAAGVIGWITKPYNAEKLAAAIQKLTKKA